MRNPGYADFLLGIPTTTARAAPSLFVAAGTLGNDRDEFLQHQQL